MKNVSLSPKLNLNLKNKLMKFVKEKVETKVERNKFRYQFMKNAFTINQSLDGVEEAILHERNMEAVDNTNYSKDMRQLLLQGVNSLDLSYVHLNKKVIDKFRLNSPEKRVKLTDRLINENPNMKEYFDKNYKRRNSINNTKVHYDCKQFVYAFMKQKNETIEKSLKADITNQKNLKALKSNKVNSIKYTNESSRLPDIYNSAENNDMNSTGGFISNNNKIKKKKVDKFNYTIYYNDTKDLKYINDLGKKYKRLKEVERREEKVGSNIQFENESKVDQEEVVKDCEVLNTDATDPEIRKRRNKYQNIVKKEYENQEHFNSQERKIVYNYMGNKNYEVDKNSPQLLKTDYYQSVFFADINSLMKDYKPNENEY